MDTTKTSTPKPQRVTLQRPKGTQDILPQEMEKWGFVEAQTRSFLSRANYHEIRTPLFELTELFERGVGEGTDIVNKEMYTFLKGDRSLTLRPENTAGVVRAFNEHGMSRWPKPIKLFYIGPMFRYERPQAGRQRQFHQIGLELFGIDSPSADAEVILLALGLFEALKLPNLSLEINNIGCPSCRESFKQAFKEAVKPYLSQLCQTCQDRYETNTFRMLDCKEEQCKAIYTHGPVHDFLGQENTCEACQAHFKELTDILTGMQVNYQRNKRLVRGLDYYTRTVFEITSNHLGAQNAVCGGGRYNNLVEALGGQPTPAVGWGIGMERLMMLLPEVPAKGLDYYIVTQEALRGHQLGQQVRKLGYRVEVDLTGKALGKQIAQADKLKAKKVLILGESEIATQQVTLKDLQTGEQSTYTEEAFLDLL